MALIKTQDKNDLYVKGWGKGDLVVLIHGTNDSIVPIENSSNHTIEKIKHAILREHPNATHGLFVTKKHRLIDDLLSFLRE